MSSSRFCGILLLGSLWFWSKLLINHFLPSWSWSKCRHLDSNVFPTQSTNYGVCFKAAKCLIRRWRKRQYHWNILFSHKSQFQGIVCFKSHILDGNEPFAEYCCFLIHGVWCIFNQDPSNQIDLVQTWLCILKGPKLKTYPDQLGPSNIFLVLMLVTSRLYWLKDNQDQPTLLQGTERFMMLLYFLVLNVGQIKIGRA